MAGGLTGPPAVYPLAGASADEEAGPADRGARAAARRATPERPAPGRGAADTAAGRSHGGNRAQRRPRRLEPPRLVIPARAPHQGARGGPDAVRVRCARPADERPRPL